MNNVSRYHPLLVLLHWLVALLLLGALAFGFGVLDDMPNSTPGKVDLLRWHMAGGVTILALMTLRLIVRLCTAQPPKAPLGIAWADRAAPLVHWAFYALVAAMVAAGFGIAFAAGLPDIVFGHSGAPLPPDFEGYTAHTIHGTLAWVLVGLIAAHFAAALYHQFMKKDGLLRRMWFGRRTA